ncbi:unnamed protein product [Ectocarpus sp. CCAP 1310/34]|nr:unnamed protein product [Ectocarpus sp. CCAP 1310/34]
MAEGRGHTATSICYTLVLLAVLVAMASSSVSDAHRQPACFLTPTSTSTPLCSSSSSSSSSSRRRPAARHPPSGSTDSATTAAGHYHRCHLSLSSSPFAEGGPWWSTPSGAIRRRESLLLAARPRPAVRRSTTTGGGATTTGNQDIGGGVGGAFRRSWRRSCGEGSMAAMVSAVSEGTETREGEGAAAVAGEARTSGTSGTCRSSTSSTSIGSVNGGRGSRRNSGVGPGGAHGEGKRAEKRDRGVLSRGMAATEHFFANGRRRKNGRQAKGDESDARGSKGGGEGPRPPAAAVAAAAAAAAAKLEGEEQEREAEGLRVVPRHVAFVMDGNGRWAVSRNLPRRTGHAEGARRAGEAVEACRRLGVEFVTLYAFSTENWRRPAGEVSFLMDLMEETLLEQRDSLRRNGIRLTVIGELDRLPARLRSLLLEIQEDSNSSSSSSSAAVDGGGAACSAPGVPPSVAIPVAAEAAGRDAGASSSSSRNSGGGDIAPPLPKQPVAAAPPTATMTLCLAISYGGRSELAAAARELAVEAAAGRLDPADIDEPALARRLSTSRLGIPDPDLVVRTSGESRLSNLLVWQSAYSELCVVGKAWPDFRRPDLVEAFRDYGRRRRRFGKTPEQMAEP